MKMLFSPLFAITVLAITGCAGKTPIAGLGLPPVTVIDGTVTQVNEDGFVLTDESGSIPVRAKLPDGKKVGLSVDEKVTVYGNLRGGAEKIFDGYVVGRAHGEQIIVSNPTPHLGCIVQSAFQQ